MNKNENVYVQRVSQLDASDLDRELHSLLKEQTNKAFKYVKPRYWSAVEPEIDSLLRLVTIGLSLHNSAATIGQQLLNMRYRDDGTMQNPSQRKVIAFTAGLVGAHWLKSREDHITLWLKQWPRAQKMVTGSLSWAETVVQLAVVVNLVPFLRNGKYSMPLERFLRLRITPTSPQIIRQLSYEYLNRELLWHGLAEFLSFAVPLINFRRLANVLFRWFPIQNNDPAGESQRTVEDLLECAICEQPPTLPHSIGCRHVYCYYCITSNACCDPNFRCPKCGLQILLNHGIQSVKMPS